MSKFKFNPEDFECWVELSSKANFEDPIGTVSEKLADKANATLEAELKKCKLVYDNSRSIVYGRSFPHWSVERDERATHTAILFNAEPLGEE